MIKLQGFWLFAFPLIQNILISKALFPVKRKMPRQHKKSKRNGWEDSRVLIIIMKKNMSGNVSLYNKKLKKG